MSVALDRYILTVLKMPSQGIKTELVTRLNNLSGLSGTPMSPMLTKWIQQNFGLSSVAAIQNWSAGKFSPEMLLRWTSVFPSSFENGAIRADLYEILTGGGVIPPVANFSGSPTTIYAGDTVAFTDLSTNTPTSWSWAFAGGTPATSTTQNPSVVYNTAGTYNVDLTASNAGGSDLESKPNYITVNYPYLLNVYSGARAAYSVRLLSSSYSGSCLRVRRSSDNTEQDIGFSGLGLNTTALSTFVGAGNGFVTKWYDQSGNAIDLSQTSASEQPQIVSSGTIITQNGLPSISFDRANSTVLTCLAAQESNFDFTSSFGFFFVLKPKNQSGDQIFLDKGQFNFGNSGYYFGTSTSSNLSYTVINSPTGAGYNLSASSTNLQVYSSNLGGGTLIQALNNTNTLTSNGVASATTNNAQLNVGRYGSTNEDFDGWMSEIIIYPTSQSANRTGIETNMDNYYSLY